MSGKIENGLVLFRRTSETHLEPVLNGNLDWNLRSNFDFYPTPGKYHRPRCSANKSSLQRSRLKFRGLNARESTGRFHRLSVSAMLIVRLARIRSGISTASSTSKRVRFASVNKRGWLTKSSYIGNSLRPALLDRVLAPRSYFSSALIARQLTRSSFSRRACRRRFSLLFSFFAFPLDITSDTRTLPVSSISRKAASKSGGVLYLQTIAVREAIGCLIFSRAARQRVARKG